MVEAEATRDSEARKGKRLEYFTIAWNSIEGLVAVVAGATAGSSIRGGNVSLIAIKKGNSDAHVSKALQSNRSAVRQQLSIVLQATAELQVGNRFPFRASQGGFGSLDAEFSNSYGWTLVDHFFHQFIRIERRGVLELSFESHQRKS